MARSLLQDVDIDGVDLVGSPANRRPFALFKAVWSTAEIDTLPDSSFAYVEPGEKDASGKTTPRSHRHLPFKDATGAVDLPHLRDALSRLDQAQISDAAKASARSTLEAAAAAHGIGDHGTKSLDGEDPMKLTKAEFRKRLATEIVDADKPEKLSDEKLEKMAKAIGIELVAEGTPAPTPVEPDVAALEKGILARVLKAIGLGAAGPEKPGALAKAAMTPEARAYMESLEERLEREEKAREKAEKAALQKRAAALVVGGWLEKDALETVSEIEVFAIEKAQERVITRLKAAGVAESFGTAQKAEAGPASLKEMVRKAVVDHLGREPIDKGEEVKVRQAIYKANPGLMQAILREEKDGKSAEA
jgi:hypothetical protein